MRKHWYQRRPKSRKVGISLVEVLIAIAIFSTAMVGLYMTMNSLNQTVATGMKRDVEAAYANMLMSQVNIFDTDVETVFDKTSTGCSGSRCSVNIAYGDKSYYTLDVRSDALTANTPCPCPTGTPATADVKQVNLYLFRNATTTTPYRQFHRDIPLNTQAYFLGASGSVNKFYKDGTGQVWGLLNTGHAGFSVSGSGYNTTVTGGRDTGNTTTFTSATTSTDPTSGVASGDTYIWKTGWKATAGTPMKLAFTFPATESKSYTVQLGFNEFNGAASGSRIFDVLINGATVDTALDINAAAGGQNKGLTKIYTTTSTTVSGIPAIQIQLKQNGGTLGPLISWIMISAN